MGVFMTPEQVRRGFSRLGAIIAIVFLIVGAIGCNFAIYTLIKDGWGEDAAIQFGVAMGGIVMAGASYLACKALAWIITGFMRDQ